ncbi:hypothetical protein SynA1562_02746 [Synechococcus sp. A15-62]|nr:hypothetical protein SynA1562_02746 [Synechococcus sp. A15-62]
MTDFSILQSPTTKQSCKQLQKRVVSVETKVPLCAMAKTRSFARPTKT